MSFYRFIFFFVFFKFISSQSIKSKFNKSLKNEKFKFLIYLQLCKLVLTSHIVIIHSIVITVFSKIPRCCRRSGSYCGYPRIATCPWNRRCSGLFTNSCCSYWNRSVSCNIRILRSSRSGNSLASKT